MFVGVARLTLQIPDSGSLKAKRQILRRVTDRLKARFNASVAEVAAVLVLLREAAEGRGGEHSTFNAQH